MDWVQEAAVRMRELGHSFSVEVLVIPVDEVDLLDRVEDAVAQIRELDWKLQDVVISPVSELADAPPEVSCSAAPRSRARRRAPPEAGARRPTLGDARPRRQRGRFACECPCAHCSPI